LARSRNPNYTCFFSFLMTEHPKSSFLETDLWRRISTKPESGDFSAEQQAAKALLAADLRSLLDKVKSGAPKERFAALGMFLHAVREKNAALPEFSPELRAAALASAHQWQLDAQGAQADVAHRSYFLLAAMDREEAAGFLLSQFDYPALSLHDRERVIHDLAELCHISKAPEQHSQTAMARLVEIAQQGLPGADKAAEYLVGRQLMRRSQVNKLLEGWQKPKPAEKLKESAVEKFVALNPAFAGREQELRNHATEWLETKSVRALNRLYFDFISHLPEGVPLQPLVGILGAPQRQDSAQNPQVYVFSSDEGPELLVHLRADGTLSAYKLK
jgi:hypothetical protein